VKCPTGDVVALRCNGRAGSEAKPSSHQDDHSPAALLSHRYHLPKIVAQHATNKRPSAATSSR
jgi:hypothetical protein